MKKTEKVPVAPKKTSKEVPAIKAKKAFEEVAAKKVTPAIKEKKVSVPPIAHGTGRRKSSVARIWLRRGKGTITINGKDAALYFDTEITRLTATTPLRVCKDALRYDVDVNIYGGGLSAQADAVKLGFARALVATDEALRPILREHGLLTVDSRIKERKKYGQKAARRKFQFVKR